MFRFLCYVVRGMGFVLYCVFWSSLCLWVCSGLVLTLFWCGCGVWCVSSLDLVGCVLIIAQFGFVFVSCCVYLLVGGCLW